MDHTAWEETETASNSELEQRPELAHAARTEPLGPDEVAAEDVLPRDLPAHVERELAVASREEPALLGKSRVDLDEVAAGDAVAVGEDQVVTGGRADGLVEDDRLAEAVVRVVDMANPHPGRSPYRVDAGLRVTRRAVVGDDDFEVGVRLTAVADEDLLEPVRLVVRAEDDRETHGVGLTCIKRRIENSIKDRKFYRVGVARRESKRPRILAAIPDVGARGCASSVRETTLKQPSLI